MARQQGVELSSGKLMLILGSFLESSGYETSGSAAGKAEEVDPEHAKRMKLFEGYSRLRSIRASIEKAKEHADCVENADGEPYKDLYEFLYDLLFDGDDCIAHQVRTVLADMERTFPDYYDPDTTYKEDALAYMGALDELIESFKNEVSGDVEPTEPRWYR